MGLVQTYPLASSLLTFGADTKSNALEVVAMKKPTERKQQEEGNMLMEKQKKQTTNILMTVKDVATYLAVTERTVYRLVKDHKLPAYKVGGQWRFKADMIESWMQKDGALESLAESSSEQESDTSRYAWKAS
jgi:excisionase family DNA binding protein